MTKKERTLEIIERLKQEYPDAGCTLDYEEAWKLLVSVRLAAQCTDARVNVVVPKLYEKFPDIDALAAAPVEEIEEIVKPCGLGHSKARDISGCMKMLRDEFHSQVPDDFDARFQCTKKEYAYYIYPSKMRDPFLTDRAYRYSYPLNPQRMQEGAQYFVGRHDFNAVRSVGTPVKSTVRTIFWCEVEQNPDGLICIRVCGDGFLYNMVRAISGTLLYVGSGKLAPADVAEILRSCDRENAGPTLPACGLFMNRLWYEDTPELNGFRLGD